MHGRLDQKKKAKPAVKARYSMLRLSATKAVYKEPSIRATNLSPKYQRRPSVA